MRDEELVQRLKDGDAVALELVIRTHSRGLYNLVYRFLGDPGSTDDVVQESFVKAFQSIESFRGDSSFKSWIYRIAANGAKNVLRSRGRRVEVDLEDVPIAVVHRDFSRLERGQTAIVLKQAVAGLAPRQKQVLELRIYDDLSFKEIAEVLDCPFDTAKANFRHAILNLKKSLGTSEEIRMAFEDLASEDDHEN